jgi:hypothetical protein
MSVREVALNLGLMDHSITLILLTDIPLNEDVTDKIRAYRTAYDNRPSNSISLAQNLWMTPQCWPLFGTCIS